MAISPCFQIMVGTKTNVPVEYLARFYATAQIDTRPDDHYLHLP